MPLTEKEFEDQMEHTAWLNLRQDTELHLDADEWSNILHALKQEHERNAEKEPKYAEYLSGIILKVEIALS